MSLFTLCLGTNFCLVLNVDDIWLHVHVCRTTWEWNFPGAIYSFLCSYAVAMKPSWHLFIGALKKTSWS